MIKPAPIKSTEFARRRKQLMRMAGDDAILILPAAPERLRSKDTTYPYRQDSDFWYLSGFPEPEAVLVLVPGRKHGEALLFCRERNAEKEAWDGPRVGQDGAVAAFGMDDAFPIADLDDILPGLLEGRSRVYYHFGRDTDFDLKLIGWVNRVRAQVRQGAQPPHEFLELGHLLHELRLFKSAGELKLMRKAAEENGLIAASSGTAKGLSGLDGAGQAGIILAAIWRLPVYQRDAIIARYSIRMTPCCECGTHTFTEDYKVAIGSLVEFAMIGLTAKADIRLRRDLVMGHFGKKPQHVKLAKQYHMNRETVSNYAGQIQKALRGLEYAGQDTLHDYFCEMGVIEMPETMAA